jgi:hypothetical protein
VSWAYAESYQKPLSVPQSLILLLTRYGMNVRLTHPPEFRLMPEVLEQAEANARAAGGSFEVLDDFDAGFRDADVVYPKSWGCMLTTPDDEESARIGLLLDWIADEERLGLAQARCDVPALPARRPRGRGHRRGHRRPGERGLRRGREPPARPEGRARPDDVGSVSPWDRTDRRRDRREQPHHRRRKHQTVEDQYLAARETDHHIAELVEQGHDVVVTHGNGPQVGFILRALGAREPRAARGPARRVRRRHAGGDRLPPPAEPRQRPAAAWDRPRRRTVVTQVEVDPDDPSFAQPTKPIGSFMTAEEAARRREVDGWDVVEDAQPWLAPRRRLTASAADRGDRRDPPPARCAGSS